MTCVPTAINGEPMSDRETERLREMVELRDIAIMRCHRRARRWEAFARKCWELLEARREQCASCTASDGEALSQLRFQRLQANDLATARRELDESGVALQEALQLDAEHELSTLQMVAALAQYRDDAEASADTAVEDRDAARRELGEVREQKRMLTERLHRLEDAMIDARYIEARGGCDCERCFKLRGYLAEYGRQIQARLAAALGKEQGR